MKPLALFALFFFWMPLVLASGASSNTITVSGRLLNNGTPVIGSVTFRVYIYDPAESCILFAEDYATLDMSSSNGNFELKVGTGTAVAGASPGLTLSQALDNRIPISGLSCSGGVYTPTANDGRKMKIVFNDGAAHSLSMIEMTSVPWAQHAGSVGGFNSTSLLRVADGNALGNISPLSTPAYNKLLDLINGVSTQYSPAAANGTTPLANLPAPTTPLAGQIWYDSGSVKYFDGTSTKTLSTGSSGITSINGQLGGTQTLVAGAAGTSLGFTSTGGTHTLNIPMASTGSVSAGLISNSDYTSFNSKLSTTTTFDGDITGGYATLSVDKIHGRPLTLSTLAPGQYLKYDGSSWVNATLSSGNLADNSDLLKVSSMPTGACSSSQTLTFSSPSGTWVCSSISISTSAITSGTISNSLLPTSAIAWQPATGGINYTGGNVGIGVATPVKALDIAGSLSSDLVRLQNTNNSGGSSIQFLSNSSGLMGTIGYENPGTPFLPSTFLISALSTTPIVFALNGSEKARFDSSGNMGVGTNSPGAKLDINGAIKSAAISNSATTIDFSTGNLQYTTAACGSFILNNMKSGGTYSLAVQGSAGGTCSFTTDGPTLRAGSTSLVQTAGKHAIFTFMVMGSNVYVASIDGY